MGELEAKIHNETRPLLMTVAEVANLLQVSERTVSRKAATGDIPGAVKVGKLWRFNRAKVESFAKLTD